MKKSLFKCKRIAIGRTIDGTLIQINVGEIFRLVGRVGTAVHLKNKKTKTELTLNKEKLKSNFIEMVI